MGDFLLDWYAVLKAAHVVSVISWMAGIFYLPRLFVYHVEQVEAGSPTDQMFQMMERRLLQGIMNPAMIATWVFGLGMVLAPGMIDWGAVWPWIKALGVIAMTVFHMWLARRRKAFISGTNALSGRQYRLMNEVPTVLMLVIVFAVIVKW